MPFPWDKSRKGRQHHPWPPIQPDDGPIEYAQRRIAWHLNDTGRTYASLTTSEMIEIAGMGRDIWYTNRPRKGRRHGAQP